MALMPGMTPAAMAPAKKKILNPIGIVLLSDGGESWKGSVGNSAGGSDAAEMRFRAFSINSSEGYNFCIRSSHLSGQVELKPAGSICSIVASLLSA